LSAPENQPTTQTENETPQPEKRVEFKFPLLMLRTKRFGKVFDKLGALKASKYISWILLATVPFIAGVALYLLINSLIATLTTPAVGQVARELGPASVLLLPGINPMLPIVYGWVAIVVAIVIHEGAHGIIARSEKLRVKSSGLVFFLIIPIGAFVDVDEEGIKKARSRSAVKVMAGGVGANIILGVLCLVAMLAIVGTVSPIIDGVYVNDVSAGLPAQAAGLQAKDVLLSIDNVTIHNTTELRTFLDTKHPGDLVDVNVARGNQWQTHYSTVVNLTYSDNRTIMGISTYDLQTQARLSNYRNFTIDRITMYIIPPTLAEGLVPFSDFLSGFYTSPLGSSWAVAGNTLFWLWFINFNLAIFNALPIYPFDGGRILDITLKRYAGKKLSEKTIHNITLAATAACVALVIAVTILPFLL
jgi:membrane-associated protease RseP (regulator of RpoE activity)